MFQSTLPGAGGDRFGYPEWDEKTETFNFKRAATGVSAPMQYTATAALHRGTISSSDLESYAKALHIKTDDLKGPEYRTPIDKSDKFAPFMKELLRTKARATQPPGSSGQTMMPQKTTLHQKVSWPDIQLFEKIQKRW